MMRLAYALLGISLEIKENIVNVLIIEGQREFREFISEIKEADQKKYSGIYLSKDYKEIQFSKYIYPIYSIQDIQFNDKKILSKVYSKLREYSLSENMYSKTIEFVNQNSSYLNLLIEGINMDLDYESFDINNYLKSVNLKINADRKSFLEMLCDYLSLVVEIFDIHIFLFFNLKEYLEEEELVELYLYCEYNKINLILCENTERKKIKNEKITIVDRDLCILFEDILLDF